MSSCEYCQRGEQHPLFVYLARASDTLEHVGLTRNPVERKQAINSGTAGKAVNKWAKAGQPNWRIILAIRFEPEDARLARHIQEQWRLCRKKMSAISDLVQDSGAAVQYYSDETEAEVNRQCFSPLLSRC